MSEVNKIPNVPNLRFPEFTDEWVKTTLNNLGSFHKGSGLSKSDLSETGNPCILYGQLYTTYKSEVITEVYSNTENLNSNSILSMKNDVIIPSSGETEIDIATARCVDLNGVILGGDLNIFRSSKVDGRFLSYLLNSKKKNDIAKLAQGKSVVHLYNESLKMLNVLIPSAKEQQKLADLLFLIDRRIDTQIKIIEEHEFFIKNLSVKIFSKNKVIPLKNIVKNNNSSLSLNKLKLCNTGYSVYGAEGKIGYIDHFNVNQPSVLIVKDGAGVGRTHVIDEEYYSILGTTNYLTTPSLGNKIYYLEQLIKNIDFSKYKVGSGIPHIYFKDYGNEMVACYDQKMIDKLNSLFKFLYTKNELEKRVLTLLQEQKKYLLNNLFI